MSLGSWSDAVAPIVAKCKVGSAFGSGVSWDADGAEALGTLLKNMAKALDDAGQSALAQQAKGEGEGGGADG